MKLLIPLILGFSASAAAAQTPKPSPSPLIDEEIDPKPLIKLYDEFTEKMSTCEEIYCFQSVNLQFGTLKRRHTTKSMSPVRLRRVYPEARESAEEYIKYKSEYEVVELGKKDRYRDTITMIIERSRKSSGGKGMEKRKLHFRKEFGEWKLGR